MSATFPTAGVNYIAGTYFSHSYFREYWYYDQSSGYITFIEDLQAPGCFLFCDKYDYHCCSQNWDRVLPDRSIHTSG